MATGLITAFVAIGVAQLVAGFTGPQFAPVVAVGGAAIDNTPPPVKNFAISAFGSNDKRVLVAGILVVLAVFAALIGVAALHRLAFGLAGLAVFTLIGLLAALTRPDFSAIDVAAGPARGGGRGVHHVPAGAGGVRHRACAFRPAAIRPAAIRRRARRRWVPPRRVPAPAASRTPAHPGFRPARRRGPPSPRPGPGGARS